MQPEIKILPGKKLVGKSLRMSLSMNKTGELWRNFMPSRKEITRRVSDDLISMQVYDDVTRPGDFNQEFHKWAAVEVENFDSVPPGMDTFILQGGLYAVFHYKGLSTDTKIFEYIFVKWLPDSIYELDNRPHFEILGEKYKNNDPDSEEDIWIPIREKNAK